MDIYLIRNTRTGEFFVEGAHVIAKTTADAAQNTLDHAATVWWFEGQRRDMYRRRQDWEVVKLDTSASEPIDGR